MPNTLERVFISECLQVYRNLPSLWNLKSKEYYDREKKNKDYEVLVGKYREMYPKANREDVKKKINALRTNYRKELKKRVDSLKDGSDCVYEPTLWYFDKMDFLKGLESAPDCQTSVQSDRETVESSIEDNSRESSTSIINIPTSSTNYRPPRKKSRIPSFEDTASSELNLRVNVDDHRHWALACAADLQKMAPIQRIYAKRAIAEVLMEGQLGLLHRDSVKINDPSFLLTGMLRKFTNVNICYQ